VPEGLDQVADGILQIRIDDANEVITRQVQDALKLLKGRAVSQFEYHLRQYLKAEDMN
jgi:hypothetical protein